MGIQKFGTRLKPYATHTLLGSSDAPAKDAVAIIDGPGLAHHIYYQLCDGRNTMPITYADIAQALSSWLNTLRSIGYKIEAILFDGALPVDKKDVRIGRLQGYIARVQNYKQNLGSAPLIMSPAARKTLPPPAFLVFCAVEELVASSDFVDVTYVVAGEADPYCIAAAQVLRSSDPHSSGTITIFSDDADLLVYELPDRACVAPFRDLSAAFQESETTWSGDLYWSTEIARRGPKDSRDLVEPAYFMSLDPHCTLDNAFRMSVPPDAASQASYARFARAFDITRETTDWTKLKSDGGRQRALAGRDSRVSEFLYQCQTDVSGGLRMYLPFLLDDPSRASAWSVGVDVRKLAYSLAIRSYATDTNVQEYRRSGARLVSILTEPYTAPQMSEHISQLSTYFDRTVTWGTEDADLPSELVWQYMIMQQTLQHLRREGSALPSIREITRITTDREHHKWSQIHLAAQYQAAFYSLRLLKQILHSVVQNTTRPDALPDHASLAALYHRLAECPRISICMGASASRASGEARTRWREVMAALVESCEPEDEAQPDRKRRKKSTKPEAPDGPDRRGLASNNPFAVLADERS